VSKSHAILVCTIGATLLLAPAAWAVNIVQDPGFEAEDASGGPVTPSPVWTVTALNGISDVYVENTFANSGSNAAAIGYGTMSQTLTTVVGTTYTVSFYVGIDDNATLSDPNATFDASLGGQDLFGGVPLTPGPPLPGSFLQCPNASTPCSAETTDTFTATSTTSVLSFTGVTTLAGASPQGIWYLDDIDVESQATTPVPEPGTGAILLASLFGLLTLARVRRL
jgi:hypothetical protein